MPVVSQRWGLLSLQHYFLARARHVSNKQTNELARIFNDSYDRVMHASGRNSREFFVAFYDILTVTNDEVASNFGIPTWRNKFGCCNRRSPFS